MNLAEFGTAGLAAGRAPAVASEAMVVTPHGWATLIGNEVLRDGGSAVDAAIAIGAALLVALPNQCGLGGDAFWLVRKNGFGTVALNASGKSASRSSIGDLSGRGVDKMPARSGAAVTVPGMIAGWMSAHSRWGTLDFERLLRPAIRAAREGITVTVLLGRGLQSSAELLGQRPESSRIFLPGGRPPRVGDRLYQLDLAKTLTELSLDPSTFYTGDLAEKISATVCNEGGWISPEDMADHQTEWTKPISTSFHGLGIEEAPPNSQGTSALLGLKLLERLGLTAESSRGDWAHWSVEVARILTAVRDAEIGDPRFMTQQADFLIQDDYLSRIEDLLLNNPDVVEPNTDAKVRSVLGATPQVSTIAHGDTVHFAVVDQSGMAVSCIQSVFDDFGSGIVVPGTGVLLHNRGKGFRVDSPDHVNSLAGSKRPMHTLSPGMITLDGHAAGVFGCMGGPAQTQLHVQLIGGLAGQKFDPVHTVERARWCLMPGDSESNIVEVEARDDLADDLQTRGHQVRLVESYAQQMGHAQMILIDSSSGALMGVADPRSDGVAMGF